MLTSKSTESKVKILSLSAVNNIERNRKYGMKSFQTFFEEEYVEEYRDIDIEDLQLPTDLALRLYEHQRIGVKWLYGLHLTQQGGILGDDMGLGKTFQVVTLLTGLLKCHDIKIILILCPVSVLQNWKREIQNHLLPHSKRTRLNILSSETSKSRRQYLLSDVFQSLDSHIIISTYQLVANMGEDFCRQDRVWDYVILDEGHVIKNTNTKTSRTLHDIRAQHKLLLTGTPIQNNLMEFYNLMTWSNPNWLGSKSSFKIRYNDPIVAAQDPHATSEQREIGEIAAMKLIKLLRPVILQRKKCEHETALELPQKSEYVIWVQLSSAQLQIYEQILKSRSFIAAMNRTKLPLESINVLKSLCRHPLLNEVTSLRSKFKSNSTTKSLLDEDFDNLLLQMKGLGFDENSHPNRGMASSPDASIFDILDLQDIDSKTLLQGSKKLRVLIRLCKHLHRHGHRTLVFSQSKYMLDIIQRVLADFGLSNVRIDGSVSSTERQRIIDNFNAGQSRSRSSDSSDASGKSSSSSSSCGFGPSICLLTTKTGGYGINLVGADRVIIYDPSWNPAEDRQAVDRAYRIGQTRDVVIYRMIMASTVEEKMYGRQVLKDGLRVVTESGTASKYFSTGDMKELFTLGPHGRCEVMEKLWDKSKEEIHELDDLGEGDIPGVLGFTRHDTLYQECRSDEVQSLQCSGQTMKNVFRTDLKAVSKALKNTESFANKSHQMNKEGFQSLNNIRPKTVEVYDLTKSDNSFIETSTVNQTVTKLKSSKYVDSTKNNYQPKECDAYSQMQRRSVVSNDSESEDDDRDDAKTSDCNEGHRESEHFNRHQLKSEEINQSISNHNPTSSGNQRRRIIDDDDDDDHHHSTLSHFDVDNFNVFHKQKINSFQSVAPCPRRRIMDDDNEEESDVIDQQSSDVHHSNEKLPSGVCSSPQSSFVKANAYFSSSSTMRTPGGTFLVDISSSESDSDDDRDTMSSSADVTTVQRIDLDSIVDVATGQGDGEDQIDCEDSNIDALTGPLGDEDSRADAIIGQLADQNSIVDVVTSQLDDEECRAEAAVGQLHGEDSNTDAITGQIIDEDSSVNVVTCQVDGEVSAYAENVSQQSTMSPNELSIDDISAEPISGESFPSSPDDSFDDDYKENLNHSEANRRRSFYVSRFSICNALDCTSDKEDENSEACHHIESSTNCF